MSRAWCFLISMALIAVLLTAWLVYVQPDRQETRIIDGRVCVVTYAKFTGDATWVCADR